MYVCCQLNHTDMLEFVENRIATFLRILKLRILQCIQKMKNVNS